MQKIHQRDKLSGPMRYSKKRLKGIALLELTFITFISRNVTTCHLRELLKWTISIFHYIFEGSKTL